MIFRIPGIERPIFKLAGSMSRLQTLLVPAKPFDAFWRFVASAGRRTHDGRASQRASRRYEILG